MATAFELSARRDGCARMLARGWAREKVCIRFDLTPAGLAAYEADPDFTLLLDTYRERWRLVFEEQALYHEDLYAKSLKALEEDLDDRTSRTRMQTAAKIAEPFLKAEAQSAYGQGGAVRGQTVNIQNVIALGETITKLIDAKQAQPPAIPLDEDPHLLDREPLPHGPNGGGS